MKEEIISIETLKEIQELKKQKKDALEFIEKKCVYDEHLQGYCFDLKKGDVRKLMYELKKDEKKES